MTRRTDVLVVGGGVTGVGVARDLAMRGADVVLVERDRLAEGTTGRMHGLLHSGARYAVADPESAEQCIRENAILRDVASHCVEDTGGMFVSLAGDDQEYFQEKLAACEAAGIPTDQVTPDVARQIEPELAETVERAFLVPDAAIDPFRLVAANAASAENHGATILTGHDVTDIDVSGGTVEGVTVATESGDTEEIEAAHVVNAAGPWVDAVLDGLSVDVPVEPAKGAMAVTNSRPVDTVVNRCRPKGEGDILVPHETTAILGTTDEPIDDPDDFDESRREIEFLTEELAEMVPSLTDARLIRSYWGVRPLYDPDADGGDSTATSRDFAVLDHEARDGIAGLTTVLGGKLTTYRLMAERVADEVGDKLDLQRGCRTGTEPLPGSRGEVDVREIMDRYEVRSPVGARTSERLGDRTEDVLDSGSPNPVVCECEAVTAAEIRDAIDTSGPDLGAVRMQTRATMGTCQGGFCSHRLALLLPAEYDQETVWEELEALLAERWRGQRFSLDGDHLSQVALNRALYHLSLNVRQATSERVDLDFERYDGGQPRGELSSGHEGGSQEGTR